MTQGVMRKETINFGAGSNAVYTYSTYKNISRAGTRFLGNPRDFLLRHSPNSDNVGRPEAGSDKTAL